MNGVADQPEEATIEAVAADRDAARREVADLRVALAHAHARVLDVERVLLERHAAELQSARDEHRRALEGHDEAVAEARAAADAASAEADAANARAHQAADAERALAALQSTKMVRWSRLPRRLYGAATGRAGRRR